MHQPISFSEIPEHGIHLKLNDLSWFPCDIVKRRGPVSVKLFLTKKGENKIEIQGRLQAILFPECDRCLAGYAYAVDAPIQLIVEVDEPGRHRQEHGLDQCITDLETVLLDEPLIDVEDLLRQQLLLALPEKKLCKNSCRGICSKCGKDLNKESCSCVRKLKDSPFAVLAQLKKNK